MSSTLGDFLKMSIGICVASVMLCVAIYVQEGGRDGDNGMAVRQDYLLSLQLLEAENIRLQRWRGLPIDDKDRSRLMEEQFHRVDRALRFVQESESRLSP